LLWLSVGVAAAVLFTLIYLIEGMTRPGYNAWQQPVSALSLGPGARRSPAASRIHSFAALKALWLSSSASSRKIQAAIPLEGL
jgi:hypothetical protein